MSHKVVWTRFFPRLNMTDLHDRWYKDISKVLVIIVISPRWTVSPVCHAVDWGSIPGRGDKLLQK